MPNYEESYVGRMRSLIGQEKLIVVATRAVICDPQGRILFVRRKDNERWVMPSGALETTETLMEGMKREVKEETGLDVLRAIPMAIYTYPDSVTAYGDPYYQISLQFLVEEWTGTLLNETDETTQARFFEVDLPPEHCAAHYQEVLRDLRQYQGQFLLR